MLLVLFGLFVVGNAALATVASIYPIGLLMIVAGIAHVMLAFRGRDWKKLLLWIAGGVLYILAGLGAFANPLLASGVLTLLIAFALLAAGVVRILFGFAARLESGWGWLVAGGVVTLLVGLVIATGWPVSSLWIIGLLLGIDLLVQGWSCLAIGLALRSRA